LHIFIFSNELDRSRFVYSAKMLFELAAEIKKELGIKMEFINLSGGIGIPYKPEDRPVDLFKLSADIKEEYQNIIVANGLDPVKIFLESGRMMTGPYGWLVTTVKHFKNIYKQYAGVDACMANLMRPGMYGAYHAITVLGKEDAPRDHTYDVVGSLCENCDKFAIDRELPKLERGDIIAIHNTGAHGHAMGFNYNAKLRSAEILLREDGSTKLIRQAETVEDYFRTLEGL